MPTGLPPNGDGKNDKFKPFTVGITRLNYFKVYNRWGQLLYSTSTLNEGWDGRLNGMDQQTGTFVWMVQGVARDGRVITKKGTVTLIR
jgi:gliding motility-associated-like protein